MLADVVLPVTQWAEEEGTMTSLEGRVIRRRKAIDPPPGVRSELEILADLAAAARVASVRVPHRPRGGLRRAGARRRAGGIADYSGLSATRCWTASRDRFWPAPRSGTAPGTPRMFGDALRRRPTDAPA